MRQDHRLLVRISGRYLLPIVIFLLSISAFGQPANDNCANASVINITSGGFSLGVFNSTTDTLANATIQTGETFPLTFFGLGLTQKSIWYKFTLPTTRSVRVNLSQPGVAIGANDAGFVVYKINNCLPANADISTKLTPHEGFDSTFHPCVDPGEYLIQVCGKSTANGPVYIKITLGAPVAAYDKQAEAYQFGTLAAPNYIKHVDYAVDCQSIENAAEVCTSLTNYQQYNKSTWHTFTTPSYFDYVGVLISGTGSTPYFINSTTFEKFGLNLYAGDARSLPFSSLILVDGCDSLSSDGQYAGKKIYKCSDLQPNTTYSIQLFFRQDFNNNVRIAITFDGTAPTQAPEPILSLVPPSNKLGVLASSPSGIGTTATDQLACNSQHSLHPCNTSLPATGIRHNGLNYNLSTFFTFTLSGSSRISISASDFSPPSRDYSTPLLMRLYAQDITNACGSLDTNNLAYPPFLSNSGFNQNCVAPGTYTLQVSGRDTLGPFYNLNYQYLSYFNHCLGLLTDLGKKFTLSITVATQVAASKYDLKIPGAFDTINRVAGVMQPLVNGVTYISSIDTFGCANTVLPFDTSCAPGNTKAIYRQFIVPDSGVIFLINSSFIWNKLYKGDADALATAQNVHSFPLRITGLTPYTNCMIYQGECEGTKVCVLPGTYTNVSFAGNPSYGPIGQTSQPSFKFEIRNTVHDSPANAENMGTLNPGVNTLTSSLDYFGCKNNAIPINGYQPCTISGQAATKAIYRQFYLSAPATIQVSGYTNYCGGIFTGPSTVFSGKASDGIAGLTPLASPFQCFDNANNVNSCNILNPGWYTVISYGSGPTYADPFQNLNQYGYSSDVGYPTQLTITGTLACPSPKYNRPYKAAIDTITGNPFLIQWAPRAGHTAAYPKTDTIYTFYKENFNCTVDTPFASHPIPNCNASLTKVAYYVFRTTQESFVQIDTKNLWGAVYAGNARTDSASFATVAPIQTCLTSSSSIQICKLQPGDYTLAVFAPSSFNCNSVTPTIYIDQVGYSRFDHAANAYDFGLIPPDSLYHDRKNGDVNPLNATRAPSNDFFYCTTGAQVNDPNSAECMADYLATIYNPGVNNALYNLTNYSSYVEIPRRNLWYSFVIDKGGYVKIKVNSKTIGKHWQYPFAVYKSNVDATIPFSTIMATGQVDSTLPQGLTLVMRNLTGSFCDGLNEISFYRDPCSPITERYYILVENRNTYATTVAYDAHLMTPNSQVEVSVLYDSVNLIQPLFDHYSQASTIGTNLGTGTYTGATDNFSCATRDTPDPIWGWSPPSCMKTLWYKFSTTVTGNIRFRAEITGQNTSPYAYNPYFIQLFRQVIPGDSTINGLQQLTTTGAYPTYYDNATATTWAQLCISPGTYYIILPGCAATNEYAYPRIQIIEEIGDFCSRPVPLTVNGPGVNVSSVLVNCHTIGSDYGEFNPTLTCPANAQTNQYKTSWFKINITGTDTLDITTYLTENTNANSSDIKYRLMNGNCGAMQERSCVQDAQTQDTYKCLPPGDYWVQVFTPVLKNGLAVTGNIDLHVNAVLHADTCATSNPCLSNAAFLKQFDCTTSQSVRFINYSTFGSSITYNWNFGYNGQTSSAVAPQFAYPALTTSQTYYITLTVTNIICGGINTYSDSITIPPRPAVNLGSDTALCNGGTLLLNAASHPGSAYLWQNGSTSSTYLAATAGSNNYYVRVTYNGCIARDTIRVNIDPVTPRTLNKYICSGDPVQLDASRGLGESYLWNTGAISSSINVYSPGIYWTDISLNGCITRDSFNVSNAAYPLGVDREVCFGGQPVQLNATTQGAAGYTWQNGTTGATFNATTAGLYWVNISFGSCSLRDTIVLSNLQPVHGNLSATICQGQSYTLPSGQIVNTAGNYRDTVRSVRGCDSLINVVNLAVQGVTVNNMDAAICPGQTYTLPWGTVVSTANIYGDTLRYTTGCDSVRRIVNLVVNATSSSTTNTTICSNQLPFTWNGTNYNVTGTYVYHAVNAVGCDSAATLSLIVKPTSTSTTNTTICSDQLPFNWNGTSYITSGTYVYHTVNAVGCDSAATLNLTIKATSTSTINTTICSDQLPFNWNGTNYNVTGTYVYHTVNAVGCDSAASLNLTVKATSSSSTNTSICSDQLPFNWNGTNYNTSGTYLYHTVNAVGCDSAATLNLIVKATSNSTTNTTICSDQLPYNWNGANYNIAGTYVYHTFNVNGCDSAATLNLIVKATSISTTNTTICSDQLPFNWNGTNYNVTGTYVYHALNEAGCDSAATLNLTVKATSTSTTNTAICSDQLPFNWNGINYITPGTYVYHTINAIGCDSAATLNLIVKATSTSTTNTAICSDQLPFNWNGTNYAAAGTYVYHTINVVGCDSAATLNLAVKATSASTTNTTICSDQLPFNWNGTNYNIAGNYVYHMNNAVGCDSAATLNLAVTATSASTTNTSICSDQLPFSWNGTNYNTGGTYVHHTINAVGCDSAATLNLIVKATSASTTNTAVCSDQLPFNWNGINYNTGGIYVYHTINAGGCDSAATLNLIVKATSISTTNTTICSDQLPFTWNGTNYNAAGTYVYHTLNVVGCDSAATLNLTVKAASSSITNTTICSDQLPFTWNSTNYNVAGIYVYHTVNTVGCDSAATLNLIVKATSTSATNTMICSDQLPFIWNGTNYNAAGTFVYHTINAVGCDSAATLNLIVKATTTSSINTTVCSDQLPFNWNGTNYNSSGLYVYHTMNAVGCDSAATLNLVVQLPISQTFNPIICAGQTYNLPWGPAVNATGFYRDTLHYTTGCDSLRRTVNLAVQSPVSEITNAVICQGASYTLPWGVIVNTTATYRDTLHYATGCDSIRRAVNLQVTAAAVSVNNAKICSDENYTLPWGVATNVAGIYNDTLRTLIGCDSLIRTINLSVDPAPSVSVSKSNDVDCMLGTAKLEASGGIKYLWTPATGLNNANIYNPVASPPATTWYRVLVTSDKGCTTSDSIQVKIVAGTIQNGYPVPNAFTPNADGMNDCFGVQAWGHVTDFSLSIYNRWGQRIFYTAKPSDCWDGRYKGVEQNPGVYVYQVSGKGFCGDIYRKGTLVLIR